MTGRVQGVFFRASTESAALPLNLKGHAINLPDGSVEVRVCGGNDALVQLEKWLQNGPPLATVDGVRETEVDCSQPERFVTH